MIVDQPCFRHKRRDGAILRINPEQIDSVLADHLHILVQKFQQPESKSHEQKPFAGFEHGNHEQSAIALSIHAVV